MSLNIFENHNLEFEVSLIKLDRVYTPDDSAFGGTITDEVVNTINIAQSDILDLEITETSISMGAQGSITLSNKFNILEQLKISTNSPNDLYIAINIKDIELDGSDINETDRVITVIGLVNSTVAGSKNIIDNILIFKWEEAFVAAARKTNLNYFNTEFTSDGTLSEDQEGPLSIVSGQFIGNMITLADNFYEKVYKLKSADMQSITVKPTKGNSPNVQHKFQTTLGFSDSIYDALNQMLKETTVGVRGEVGRVPYFRFVNTLDSEGKVKRKLKFSAFITDEHIDLIHAVQSNVTKANFSNVYIEKFSIGPDADVSPLDPNITIYNKIERYNITRPDVGRLRVEVWGDYQRNRVSSSSTASEDHSSVNSKLKCFSEISLDYLKRDLAGLAVDVNIPLLNQNEIKVFDLSPNTLSTRQLAKDAFVQQENLIANTVIKSFLTINETISFTSKGSVIRQPNKFIWIERDAALEEEDYHKLWYVNSVTHKFKDGKYTTDIIATKLFGNTTKESITNAASRCATKLPLGGDDGIGRNGSEEGEDRVVKSDQGIDNRIFGNEKDTSKGRQKREDEKFLEMMDAAKAKGGNLIYLGNGSLGDSPADKPAKQLVPKSSRVEKDIEKAVKQNAENKPETQALPQAAKDLTRSEPELGGVYYVEGPNEEYLGILPTEPDNNTPAPLFSTGDDTEFKALSQKEFDLLMKTAEGNRARDNRKDEFNPNKVTLEPLDQ